MLKSDDDSLEVDKIERREDDFTKELNFVLGITPRLQYKFGN